MSHRGIALLNHGVQVGEDLALMALMDRQYLRTPFYGTRRMAAWLRSRGHSRYVLAWRLSNTLEADFCVAALEEALSLGQPEIFNTDQGSQFTSEAFTGLLLEHGIQISMDGKGRCMDNVFVERLWRSIKYEEVYLKAYQNGPEARAGIGNYFQLYNQERPHQALGYRTPRQMFEQGLTRRCLQDQEGALLSNPEVTSLAMVTKDTAGDSLNLALSLSK